MKKAVTLSVMLYMILLSIWCLSFQVSAENIYGFTMPIDGLDLEKDIYEPFGNGHRGIDTYKGGYGTTIRAVQSGTVVAQANLPHNHASSSSVESWGTYVRINHGNIQGVKVETLYAHMQQSSPVFSNGSTVSRGQTVGYMGNTGYVYKCPCITGVSTQGSHLHFEVLVDGVPSDPKGFFTSGHTHTYEYVWPEGTHPHVNYEQCTICGDLRSMGTNAATYEYTYYLTDHPHRQYGMCNMCHIEKFTGEYKTCSQAAIYTSETHPHRRYRVYACGADEWLDSYGECTCK